MRKMFLGLVLFLIFEINVSAQTVALWLFDEQVGLYPSCILSDAGPNDFPMVLGKGGQIVSGKFGNALEPIEHSKIEFPTGSVKFGLQALPIPDGRSVEPMNWMNARFCGLMTSGENHLRKEVAFKHATKTKLNLGAFDWTVEFWFLPTRSVKEEGVVFEIGKGPRGENDQVTQLLVNADQTGFILINNPGRTKLLIASNATTLSPKLRKWHHYAFVYSVNEQQLLTHSFQLP